MQACTAAMDFAAAIDSGSLDACSLPLHSAPSHALPPDAAAFAQTTLAAVMKELDTARAMPPPAAAQGADAGVASGAAQPAAHSGQSGASARSPKAPSNLQPIKISKSAKPAVVSPAQPAVAAGTALPELLGTAPTATAAAAAAQQALLGVGTVPPGDQAAALLAQLTRQAAVAPVQGALHAAQPGAVAPQTMANNPLGMLMAQQMAGAVFPQSPASLGTTAAPTAMSTSPGTHAAALAGVPPHAAAVLQQQLALQMAQNVQADPRAVLGLAGAPAAAAPDGLQIGAVANQGLHPAAAMLTPQVAAHEFAGHPQGVAQAAQSQAQGGVAVAPLRAGPDSAAHGAQHWEHTGPQHQ